MTRIKNPQDFWAGVLFLAVGVFAAWYGRAYTFGTATKMGPGYLPEVLSWGMAGLGAFLLIRGLFDSGEPLERSLMRPQLFILAAILVFAFTIERFGLAVAVISSSIVAAMASSQRRWREVLLLSVGLAILCALLFVKLLGQPLAIWTWGN
jgi:putative tricarboxylic transport membrane protein